jgi:hypothetical protein
MITIPPYQEQHHTDDIKNYMSNENRATSSIRKLQHALYAIRRTNFDCSVEPKALISSAPVLKIVTEKLSDRTPAI